MCNEVNRRIHVSKQPAGSDWSKWSECVGNILTDASDVRFNEKYATRKY
jgi:hypothetical protein